MNSKKCSICGESLLNKHKHCYFCNIRIFTLRYNNNKHVNTMQDPSERGFCSEKCKLDWIKAMQIINR